MRFDCFYYPEVNDEGEIVKSTEEMKPFKLGDKVPSKTLYYNYGSRYAIFQNGKFYAVENSILKQTLTEKDLKYPLNLVFNKGTQLKIFSPSELPSVRLFLDGEFELEKELGIYFFLSQVLNRRIRKIQYEVMSDLTNSSRDFNFVNQEIDIRTKKMIEQLTMVEGKFYNLTRTHSELKDAYLNYMNFGNQENLFELSIFKFFKEDTEEYREYVIRHLIWNSKPIYPKFKLDNLMNSSNYRTI